MLKSVITLLLIVYNIQFFSFKIPIFTFVVFYQTFFYNLTFFHIRTFLSADIIVYVRPLTKVSAVGSTAYGDTFWSFFCDQEE